MPISCFVDRLQREGSFPKHGCVPTHGDPTAAYGARVAVWGMDNVFPSLERTLSRMNSAQKQFGFELAELSVPLDVWDLQRNDERMFLWAERLANHLQGMVRRRRNLD